MSELQEQTVSNDTPIKNSEQLDKSYDGKKVEAYWYKIWSDAGIFRADAQACLEEGKKAYVIMMPPPNVTGVLHNGHALFVTLQDVLIRYQRMMGKNALWLPGVDHAGIATQSVVERELKRHEQKSRHDLGREEFVKRIWQWKDKNGARIIEQLKVLGASADWSRERFTLDEQCSASVNHAFVQLWNDGLIYRGERLVNWDPASQTALSNEEVEHEERDGELWQFAYKIKGSSSGEEIVVATTRPETMLGDTAVAVHPEDERYLHLHGKELLHPFFAERKVIVVADEYVDREFGTGAVKITPAHDPNDFDIGQRHSLEMINIFDLEAKVNENGAKFCGLERSDARKAVKKAIDELGLFRGTTNIKHNVSISERSGVAIEPMLSRQFFVNAKPLAKKACEAIDSGETKIYPSSWVSTWDHFMKNPRDWCISRQLWWGHRIPVFYNIEKVKTAIIKDAEKKGHSTKASEALQAGKSERDLLTLALHEVEDSLVRDFSTASTDNLETKYPGKYLQEEDVLDTWFSSGLWPFSTLGWPEKTDDLAAFYPGAVLETGFDILFFWVARMMMFGCYFMGKAPFKDIYLHSMVRDSQGRKMSKSLGNAIDPLDVIEGISLEDLLEKTKTYPVPEKNLKKVLKGISHEYKDGIAASGADGLRFSLAALSGQGRDVKLAMPRVAGYRAFLNKIWNATRFALMRVGDGEILSLDTVKADLRLSDRWILSRLQAAVDKCHQSLSDYRFDHFANTIYQFFWTEFCDWYIEMSKGILFKDDAELTEELKAQKEATRSVLIHVLDTSMRMIHPLCPFQSEEIWQKLPGKDLRWEGKADFCAVAQYPVKEEKWVDQAAEFQMNDLISIIFMIRNARQESGLPAQQRVPAVIVVESQDELSFVQSMLPQIQRIALLSEVDAQLSRIYEIPTFAACNADRKFQVVIPLDGLIDIEKEKQRVSKDLLKSTKEMKSLAGRLSNDRFISKAPEDVIIESKQQLKELTAKVERLEQTMVRLNSA